MSMKRATLESSIADIVEKMAARHQLTPESVLTALQFTQVQDHIAGFAKCRWMASSLPRDEEPLASGDEARIKLGITLERLTARISA